MKKFFALILALVMALSLVACGGSNGDNGGSKAKLRFVTGGESGTYYAFGSVIAQHATNNAGVDVVGLVGNGSQSNVQELQDGNAELAFCQSDVMAYAYNGTNIFEEHGKVDCFSTVAALYMEQVQIVTVDPTIKTVAEDGAVTGTPDRSTLRAVQTPQVFEADLLKAALQSALENEVPVTDDCSAVERLGEVVYLIDGDEENLKITTPVDLVIAEAILAEREGR